MKKKKDKMWMAKNIFSQNLNFIEFPIWFHTIPKEEVDGSFTWDTGNGYVFNSKQAPTRHDILFLYQLLLQCQENKFNPKVVTTRYKLLQECDMPLQTFSYKKVAESVEKWKHVNLSYKETFYIKGKKKQSMAFFGVIDLGTIDGSTGKVVVKFNDFWLDQIKQSGFCKLFDFNCYKAIKQPMALRLFEIFSKNLTMRTNFTISVDKMAKLMCMRKYKVQQRTQCIKVLYDGRILASINRCVDNLNNLFSNDKLVNEYKIRQGMIVHLATYKNKDGESIMSFTRQKKVSYLKNKPTEKKNTTPKIEIQSEEESELHEWLKAMDVSCGGIKKIFRVKEKLNIFPIIKKEFDESGKLGPGWLVTAFTCGGYQEKSEVYSEIKKNWPN